MTQGGSRAVSQFECLLVVGSGYRLFRPGGRLSALSDYSSRSPRYLKQDVCRDAAYQIKMGQIGNQESPYNTPRMRRAEIINGTLP